MNTQDPIQLPGDPTQGENMGTTDMSWLLGQPQEQQLPEEDGWNNSEMYKKVIEALMEKVQNKYGELNTVKFSSKNQNDAQRNDILKTIFESMKQSGVDPSDQEAINRFMAELEQSSPDLYELFTEALNWLLWPDTTEQSFSPVETSIPESADQSQPQSPPEDIPSPQDFSSQYPPAAM